MDYPSNSDVNLHNGKFTDGDPELGIPASRDPADWASAVTDEIINLIAAMGLVPAELDVTQLATGFLAEVAARTAAIAAVAAKLGTFVNAADGGAYIDSLRLGMHLSPVDTWITVGPTGSGAARIWAPLDSVPVDAAWIEVHFWEQGYLSELTPNTILNTQYRFRKNGTGVFPDTTCGGDGIVNANGVVRWNVFTAGIKIPVSNRMFQFYHSETGSSIISQGMLRLTGYGYNRI